MSNREAKDLNNPQPGHYAYRMGRNGPTVPALIYYGPQLDPETGLHLDRSYVWALTLNGDVKDVGYGPNGHFQVDLIERVWLHGEPITKAKYDHMIALADWEARYGSTQPEEPETPPQAKLDPLTAPIPMPS